MCRWSRGAGTAGVEVEEVLTDGPAAIAGLRRGDTITAVAGRIAARVDQLAELLGAAGVQVSVAYLDSPGGEYITTVRLGGKGPCTARRFETSSG
jgi:S1-C subfamily serine protease